MFKESGDVILEHGDGRRQTLEGFPHNRDRQIVLTSDRGRAIYEYAENDADGRRVYRYINTEPLPVK